MILILNLQNKSKQIFFNQKSKIYKIFKKPLLGLFKENRIQFLVADA